MSKAPEHIETTPKAYWRCDVPGCRADWVVKRGGEQRCYEHALARGNELRAQRGLPPVTFDDEGNKHVRQ